MLYRKNEEQDIAILLPSFISPISPSAHLSADLVLRFLPDIIKQLKLIDPEDALIGILERQLVQWYYSGVHIHFKWNCSILNLSLQMNV